MTVIAVKKFDDRIEMAADNQISMGYRIAPSQSIDTGKIFQQNGMLIAGTGTSSEAQMMYLFTRNHKPLSISVDDVIDFVVEFKSFCTGVDSNFTIGNSYVICFEKSVFWVCGGTMQVFEVPEYIAIGAGGETAMAALYLGESPSRAVEVACDLNAFCCLPVDTVSYNF